MARDEFQSPENTRHADKQSSRISNVETMESLLSPRFRSAAAMAGWDEETLLLASMIIEDTPERESKHKRRASQQFKTPPASSRRKRRAQQQNPSPIPVGAICLNEEENEDANGKKNKNTKVAVTEEKKKEEGEGSLPMESGVSSSAPVLPCMDRLREELSCAICLEICFEPSTTTCGHSFCKKCLKSAADKCGKRCPKCRQLISNGRSCTVNTVLWNTIQLLFPDEVEARKIAVKHTREANQKSPKEDGYSTRNVAFDSAITGGNISRRARRESSQEEDAAMGRRRNSSWRRTRIGPSQEEDAALALRLQREEFMDAFGRVADDEPRISLYSARSNLRAMASRARELRLRGR
ncbi:hypothetical protein MRB53_004481 [Persea americana]|uniref:Uncharacterized protein n=1 Tax=Persea americana TaxID=3435 RepID=A0ACC2MBB1_PERAE|nr:hypothetical protein MRB53_004481 [Persea americana]